MRWGTAVPLLIVFGQCHWSGEGRSSEKLPAMSGFGLFRIMNYFYGLIGITAAVRRIDCWEHEDVVDQHRQRMKQHPAARRVQSDDAELQFQVALESAWGQGAGVVIADQLAREQRGADHRCGAVLSSALAH